MSKNKLIIELLQRVFLIDRPQRICWANKTQQSMQPDSGLLGEHLVSLITGIPGKGTKGKGVDLVDHENLLYCSEIKTASKLDQQGGKHDGHPKQQPFKKLHYEIWPHKKNIFIVMIDDPYIKSKTEPVTIARTRVWAINPSDPDFLSTMQRNWDNKSESQKKNGFTWNFRPGPDVRWPLDHKPTWMIDGGIPDTFNPPMIFEGIVFFKSGKIEIK